MANNGQYIQHIFHTLSDREKYEALAEECAELSQAALKMIRASGESANYTPKSETEAYENLCEEILDVCSVLLLLTRMPGYQEVHDYQKWERWAKRLGFEEREQPV